MRKVYRWTVVWILLGFVLAGLFLAIAPDRVPAHYNYQGEIDRWGSKYEFLIMPFFNLIFAVFMAWLARREGRQGRDMNERIVSVMNNWILVLFNGLWLVFMWKAVDVKNPAGLGELFGKLIMMILCVSLIPIGNIMPKASRNSMFGLRTKWSMANDHCWQQSQRIGGYLMMGTGILGVILSAILPAEWAGYVFLVLMGLVVIGSTWASYRIFQKDQIR